LPVGGRGGVCRDDLACRLFISAAATLGAILGASAGAGTVAGSDAVVAGGLGAALADVQMAVAVAAGWD
jgi:hypothetical protein